MLEATRLVVGTEGLAAQALPVMCAMFPGAFMPYDRCPPYNTQDPVMLVGEGQKEFCLCDRGFEPRPRDLVRPPPETIIPLDQRPTMRDQSDGAAEHQSGRRR